MNYLKKTEDYMITFVEEIGKGLYCFNKFVSAVFYETSGIGVVKKGLDAYSAAKIDVVLNDINYEHKKLSKETLKDFYENLTEQNLEYLYSIYEKSRISTYRLHIKILARLSLKLIQNKTLNYYENSLLANINLLTEDDFLVLYEELEQNLGVKENILFKPDKPYELSIISKFINMGILSQSDAMYISQGEISYRVNEYSDELYKILKEIKDASI